MCIGTPDILVHYFSGGLCQEHNVPWSEKEKVEQLRGVQEGALASMRDQSEDLRQMEGWSSGVESI